MLRHRPNKNCAKRMASAFELLDKSYRINLKLNRLDGTCYVGSLLGQLLCMGGNSEEGIEILQRSKDGFAKLGRSEEAFEIGRMIGNIKASVVNRDSLENERVGEE